MKIKMTKTRTKGEVKKSMNKTKVTKSKVRNTKTTEKKKASMAEQLNRVSAQATNRLSSENENNSENSYPVEMKPVEQSDSSELNNSAEVKTTGDKKPSSSTNEQKTLDESIYEELFDMRDAKEFVPQDFIVNVAADSLESQIGYSSLGRQLHNAFLEKVRFYVSPGGGSPASGFRFG